MQGNVEKNVSRTVDLSHIEKVDLAWLLNGDKPNIEYIHLPMNLIGNGNVVAHTPSQAFRKCTALKAIWCGDNTKPSDGTADFTGTGLTGAAGNASESVTGITTYIYDSAN